MSLDESAHGHGETGHADNSHIFSGHTFYRHFKGRYYQVVGEALDTATEGRVVVYRTLYPSDHALFTRPYDEFHGWKITDDGERVRRFTPVAYADLPDDARVHVIRMPDLAAG